MAGEIRRQVVLCILMEHTLMALYIYSRRIYAKKDIDKNYNNLCDIV